jgi:hypothetical protein
MSGAARAWVAAVLALGSGLAGGAGQRLMGREVRRGASQGGAEKTQSAGWRVSMKLFCESVL